MKRRINGMQNILDRAGKPLHFQLARRPQEKGDETASSSGESSEEEEEEEDRPFEPLLVWNSPHQGGEPKGLPCKM